MAKLSARGRTALASLVKEWRNPHPARVAQSGESHDVELEWLTVQRRYMSDGHVLVCEKWKHHQHDKPFNTGWKDRGKITPAQDKSLSDTVAQYVAQRLAKGWQHEKGTR